jgi:hypothetical protein
MAWGDRTAITPCLMGDNDPTGSQQVLDHPQAERETEIEPHGVGNDFSGKAMAAV